MSARACCVLILLVPLLGGCTPARHVGEGSPGTSPAPPEEARSTPAAELPSAAPRLLVRRARLALTAEHPAALAPHAERIATATGGHVDNLVVNERDRLRAVLRIPAPRLDEALAALEELGEVKEKRISADDVTEQSADLEARLHTLRGVRDRLRQYLERADGISDLVAVERELARVQSEIEILEGRLERLRTDIALTEVTLDVRRERVLGPLGLLGYGLGRAVSKLFVLR